MNLAHDLLAGLVEGGDCYPLSRAAHSQHLLLSGNKLGKGPQRSFTIQNLHLMEL